MAKTKQTGKKNKRMATITFGIDGQSINLNLPNATAQDVLKVLNQFYLITNLGPENATAGEKMRNILIYWLKNAQLETRTRYYLERKSVYHAQAKGEAETEYNIIEGEEM